MNTPCSIALLESALAGSLPADDETALHRHLEECEQCSAALERMAGGPAWCQEAAALLAEDELDAALPAGHSLAGHEWSDVDFTVEHLEPADRRAPIRAAGADGAEDGNHRRKHQQRPQAILKGAALGIAIVHELAELLLHGWR